MIDRIKLRDYKLGRLFLIGGKSDDNMWEKKQTIRSAMQGKGRVFFDFEGNASSIKPYQAKLWVSPAPDKDYNRGIGYMDYLRPEESNGVEAVISLNSAFKKYESEFGYFPAKVLLVRVV